MTAGASPRALRRVRVRAALLLVVVFAAGSVSALAATRLRGVGSRITVEATGGVPTELARLHLTPLQERRVAAILGESRARTERVLVAIVPRLRAIMDSTDDQVRAVLTPAQRSAFDAERRRHRSVFLLKRRPDSGRSTIDSIGNPGDSVR